MDAIWWSPSKMLLFKFKTPNLFTKFENAKITSKEMGWDVLKYGRVGFVPPTFLGLSYGLEGRVFSQMTYNELWLPCQSKPEDQWSCIALLSAEDMLKSAVIEEKTLNIG